jgi:serine/threonine protein kinase
MKEGKIAEGSFGKVSRKGDTIIKKSDLLEGIFNKNLHTWNLNEIFFLKTNQVSFVPMIQKIDVHEQIFNNYIEVTENYMGMTLDEWALKYFKIDFFPDLLCQAAHILCWLKDLHVVHGDIKTDNLIINNKHEIGLIDFGSVTMVYPENTDNFSDRNQDFIDPRYYLETHPISYDFDMYSFGVVCIALLGGNLLGNKEYVHTHKEEYTTGLQQFYKNYQPVLKEIPMEIQNIITRMLHPDLQKRITPEELYNLPYLDKVRSKYPLIKIQYTEEDLLLNKKMNNLDFYYFEQISHIGNQVQFEKGEEQKLPMIVSITVYLLYKYAYNHKLVSDEDVLGCFNLALVLSKAKYNWFKNVDWKHSLGIAEKMDWKIYPKLL